MNDGGIPLKPSNPIEKSEELLVNYNLLPEIRPSHLPKSVYIWDETLRDGEQTPGVALTPDEKLEIAKLMDEMGVSIIAVGYPAVSETEKEAVKLVASEGLSKAKVATPARPTKKDIDLVIECNADEVPIFLATSDLHLRYKLKMSREESIKKAVEAVEYAKDHGLIVDFVAEDCSRSNLTHLKNIFKAVAEAKADKIVIADTVGFMLPASMKYLTSKIRDFLWEECKLKIPLAVHCHNDFGLATANTLAAIEEGVTYPHVTVNGYGERAGNAPFEEVVMALEILYDVRTGIKKEKIYELSLLVEEKFGLPLPVHKAIVGRNAFSHESGIHVHGVMAHSLTYEPFSPEIIGRQRKFYFGKHTGKYHVEARLKTLGITVSEGKLREIVDRIKKLHEIKKRYRSKEQLNQIKEFMEKVQTGVTEKEFFKIVEEVTGIKITKRKIPPPKFRKET